MTEPDAGRDRAPVLAGFDGSSDARRAVRWAARDADRKGRTLVIARAHQPQVTAAGYSTMVPTEYLATETVRNAAMEALAELADEISQEWPSLPVETVFREGAPATVLSEIAGEVDAELLVLGACGLSAVPRMVLGSVAAEVIHLEWRPTVVVRGHEPATNAPVVLGVDGSPNSYRAIGFAFDFAYRHRCPITAIHAWSDLPLALASSETPADPHIDEPRTLAQEQVEQWHEHYPTVTVQWFVAADRPAHALLEHAEGARMLVVGSHGRGALRRVLLGSVSHAVLHNADCPVAVLREVSADRPAQTQPEPSER